MKTNVFLISIIAISFFSFQKGYSQKTHKFTNIGNVVYNEKEKQFYNKKGQKINLSSYRKNGELLTVSSLTFSSSIKVANTTASTGSPCGYQVNINEHNFWDSSAYDQSGDIGVDIKLGAFVFRPGNLYMKTGTFIYRGTQAESLYFLKNLKENDPTNSVVALSGTNCSGTDFSYTK